MPARKKHISAWKSLKDRLVSISEEDGLKIVNKFAINGLTTSIYLG